MGSSQQERLAIVLTSGKDGSPGSRVLEALTPASRNGGSSLSDESIWLRLREAGFDEEYIKRRDKAALIAYIAKLEAEDWASKYEQVKGSVNTAETTHKLDQATHLSALAEARKQEESLKKALGIEKECMANIEKTLHEMRAESAETKIAAESKMAEAHSIMKDAQKKFLEAEAKLHAAESLQAEASRYNRAAERKLQEVEEHQDELRRRLISFNSDTTSSMEPAITSKDLLGLEQINSTSSSLESTLAVCKKESLSQTLKPHTCGGKLVTTSVPTSQVLGKVKDFLGVMAKDNKRLQHDAKENSSKVYDIEVLTGNETEYIEMDLVLGVADLHTPEAVAAAEFAMAGSQPVIPLTTGNGGSDTSSSDDNDDSSDDDEDEDKTYSRNKFQESKSDKDGSLSNGQLKKRQKIIELL